MKIFSFLFLIVILTLGVVSLCACNHPASVTHSSVEPETSIPSTATVSMTITLEEPLLVEPESTPTIPDFVPEPRRYHSFVYNSTSQKIVMVGGQSEFSGNLDMVGHDNTWAYDPLTNIWSWMNPPTEPPKIFGSQLAYDTESDRVIFYGGGYGRGFNANGVGDTWAYDLRNNTWTRMSDGPIGFFGARIVYDSESDKIILFGGSDWQAHSQSYSENQNISYNETWVYDFNSDTWTNMQPVIAPPGRWYHPMAYHTQADRVIIWGGTDHAGNAADDGAVWTYDYNANTWESKEPGAGPSPDPDREGAAMVYDSQSDKVILYGGDSFGSETWAYDLSTNTWMLMDSGNGPSGQINLSFFAMEYCPEIDRVILSGGFLCEKSCSYLKGTWVYNLETNVWENLAP